VQYDRRRQHPGLFQFGNAVYKLESMLLNNHNSDSCNMGHALAGVTCRGQRYMYNGWVRGTKDPAARGGIRNTACQLMPFDWAKFTRFRLSRSECAINNVPPTNTNMKSDLVFDTSLLGLLVYVRVGPPIV
jgi:hypothetical protein